MFPPHKPYIPKSISQVMDYLGMMMLDAPTFVDRTGYFPDRNLAMAFYELNEGLNLVRADLGEERYRKLIELSEQMQADFEADPENKTGGTLAGRNIILKMEDILKRNSRKSQTKM